MSEKGRIQLKDLILSINPMKRQPESPSKQELPPEKKQSNAVPQICNEKESIKRATLLELPSDQLNQIFFDMRKQNSTNLNTLSKKDIIEGSRFVKKVHIYQEQPNNEEGSSVFEIEMNRFEEIQSLDISKELKENLQKVDLSRKYVIKWLNWESLLDIDEKTERDVEMTIKIIKMKKQIKSENEDYSKWDKHIVESAIVERTEHSMVVLMECKEFILDKYIENMIIKYIAKDITSEDVETQIYSLIFSLFWFFNCFIDENISYWDLHPQNVCASEIENDGRIFKCVKVMTKKDGGNETIEKLFKIVVGIDFIDLGGFLCDVLECDKFVQLFQSFFNDFKTVIDAVIGKKVYDDHRKELNHLQQLFYGIFEKFNDEIIECMYLTGNFIELLLKESEENPFNKLRFDDKTATINIFASITHKDTEEKMKHSNFDEDGVYVGDDYDYEEDEDEDEDNFDYEEDEWM